MFFLYETLCHNLIYIVIKFHQDISKDNLIMASKIIDLQKCYSQMAVIQLKIEKQYALLYRLVQPLTRLKFNWMKTIGEISLKKGHRKIRKGSNSAQTKLERVTMCAGPLDRLTIY